MVCKESTRMFFLCYQEMALCSFLIWYASPYLPTLQYLLLHMKIRNCVVQLFSRPFKVMQFNENIKSFTFSFVIKKKNLLIPLTYTCTIHNIHKLLHKNLNINCGRDLLWLTCDKEPAYTEWCVGQRSHHHLEWTRCWWCWAGPGLFDTRCNSQCLH